MLPEKLEIEEKQKKWWKSQPIYKRLYLNIKNLITSLPWTAMLLVMFGLLMFVIAHEATHGVIFEEYGCTNITYYVRPEAFYTHAECGNLPAEVIMSLNEVQALTEAIQYPMGFIIAILTLIAIKKP